MDGPYCLIMTSVALESDAERLAGSLVQARLAACVQITATRSVYRWKGKVIREPEYRLLIKTSSRLYGQVEAYLREHHPYEVAEILRLPIDGGSEEYLAWIVECTS